MVSRVNTDPQNLPKGSPALRQTTSGPEELYVAANRLLGSGATAISQRLTSSGLLIFAHWSSPVSACAKDGIKMFRVSNANDTKKHLEFMVVE